ncbi:hypothetical protein [Phenylobacterium sp.]|uniref:hypothetical protein n=1 Tax=Phenylobacterium sp. TaxID=1871053 RepID=UPI0028987332|nr:hypothetical protein [Phenylobacterium sp.]
MELRTVGGRLKASSAFKLVATGYLVGAGAIFIPLFTLVTVMLVATGAPARVNGEVVEGGELLNLMPILLGPIILAMQAVTFGVLVVFGLWLFQKRWPLLIVAEDAAPPPKA